MRKPTEPGFSPQDQKELVERTQKSDQLTVAQVKRFLGLN
jgi:hypothetical protein